MKFSELFQSYNSMELPSYALTVGGTALKSEEDTRLLRTVCTLSSRFEAGYLLAEAQIDAKTNTGKSWLKALQLGAKCEFALGYCDSNTTVFVGFLYDMYWNDPLDDGYMTVEALFLDVRGKLMQPSTADAGTARTLSQLVKKTMDNLNSSGLGIKSTVKDIPKEWDLPFQRKGPTDYDVLCGAAEFLSYEFYAWADELYFGPSRPESGPVVEFDGADGISLLRRHATLAGQYGGISVSGTDDAGERVSFAQKRTGGGGYGTDKLSSVLNGQLQFPSPSARTMAQVRYLAQARMQAVQRRSGGLECRCLGLPELRPGRYVKVSKCGEPVNGSFYIHTVRHTFDAISFETWIEAED